MIEIEKPQIECIETPGDASYGKYVIEPLERGYGTTLGNALRRIMLSSLPGTAATSIKIAGVQHEFSTIPGVKEDVTEIVLNVKSLLTKLHCEGTKTVYIEAAGPCEVTAGDIKSDGEVEVLNPELHLATLDVGATLSMEITLSHGRGYVSADRNKAQRPGVIGVIPIDSIYTPVYKVNYTVENTRVGSMSDFDKLTLEVWTDSTISARDAVSLGAKILCDHFALFTDLSDTLDGRPIVVEKSADPQSTVLDMTIEEAREFFDAVPALARKLQTLMDVGLTYIRLGQSATTLSGGEAQRVKLATELAKKDTGKTFYILDEPTTGLHFEDIRVLMGILDHLVDRGNTVLVIEHNLDVIRLADYLIDMGPEGGQEGGFIVAQGTPEEIVAQRKGYTWAFLKEVLEGEESHRG